MIRFHEVNELYCGTLNQVHHFIFATDLKSNECFTFRQAVKQNNILAFVEAMQKEISDHESRNPESIGQ